MLRIMTGVVLALGAAGLAWGQEGGDKKEGKPPAKPEGGKEGEKGQGPMLSVAEVDTNGDGWISAMELKIALSKLGGGPKDGVKPKPKPGEGGEKPKPDGFKEGDFKKPPPKPDGFKDGGDKPKPKPDGFKEGEKKEGDKKEGDKKDGEK